MVDLPSGRQIRTLKFGAIALSPGAKDIFSSWTDDENGGAVKNFMCRGDDAVLVTLGDKHAGSWGSFSADGNRLAWWGIDGPVTVCDIDRVQRRLAEVGLGW